MRSERAGFKVPSVGIGAAVLLFCLGMVMAPWASAAEAKAKGAYVLDAVPKGYFLHAYDDCGVPARQPHVLMDDSYCWTFNTSDTDADLKSRSAVFSYKSVNLLYTGLDPKRSYVLALTYANDHVYKRVQSAWANGVQLHEPYAIPKARAVRLVVKVPEAVTRTGRMALQFRIHGEVNATVSVVELWADAPPKEDVLRVAGVSGLVGDLTGQVLDLAYEPVPGAAVELLRPGTSAPLAATLTGPDGRFRVPRAAFEAKAGMDLQLVVRRGGHALKHTVPASELSFTPVRYRPIPVRIDGVGQHRLVLDGTWRIDPQPGDGARTRPLEAPAWKDFQVPGQWRQQGLDLPQDRSVAMAREFTVPREWSGKRIFLRFDAIHAGTHYWLNGQRLGYSENLFTPVEWEITPHVRLGGTNRLDLEMKVDTVSEKLSYSCGYAFHNLGGIDRSVSVFAVPALHVQAMRLATRLDRDYRDADLDVEFVLDNPQQEAVAGLAIGLELLAPDGRPVPHSVSRLALGPLPPGTQTERLVTRVANPLKWSAEKPHLYRLALELRSGGTVIERIERSVGFRQIEVRGSALLVNGVPVKLAGACRHEIDPLSGRANTMQHAEKDVKLLKAANLNYLRTSHYPPTMELVEAADKHGMYLEVEAPFCWVGPTDELEHLREVLVPTSAMVDFYHSHPSVLLWSLANESQLNRCFEISHDLVRQLDPTRPTTFNNPDPKRICEIANLHYPPMPYDEQAQDDPRPLLLGEYFFPVCHEQTDVRINPGLREFFGFGHSDPDSPFARQCAESFTKPFLKPCTPPGAWSHVDRSRRVVGGAIWASLDEPFYFPDGKRAGYAWHHGYWGILDAWRRPKPEWWLTKLVFSPVWFPVRRVDFAPGQTTLRLPVENRYSFTDLKELDFTWELGGQKGSVRAAVPPRSRGELAIPIPPGTSEGSKLILRANTSQGELVNVAAIQLGRETPVVVPRPGAGAPQIAEEGAVVLVRGDGFALVFDRQAGDFRAADPRHQAAVVRFPAPHVTQYDFGDLAGPHGKPYAVYPDAKTRVVEHAALRLRPDSVDLVVRDRYALFSGSTTWRIDRRGLGTVQYEYTYSGPELDTREAGVRFFLKPACDEVTWRRWSEWQVFPEDSICRTVGRAKALRTGKRQADPEGAAPTWPWSLDQTELGTADFRAVKFNVYEAALLAPDGSGLRVHANADVHVRPCLADDGVLLHALMRCPLGQVVLRSGDRIAGQGTVELVRAGSPGPTSRLPVVDAPSGTGYLGGFDSP